MSSTEKTSAVLAPRHSDSRSLDLAAVAALSDLASALDGAPGAGALSESVQAFVEAFGYQTASGLRVPTTALGRRSIDQLGTLDTGFWAALLAKQEASFAALMMQFASDAKTLEWSPDGSPLAAPKKWRVAASKTAREHEISSIFVLPTLNCRHHIHAIAITSDRQPLQSMDRRALALGLRTIYLHHRLTVEATDSPVNTLTRREAEISRWIAEGKSDWEIGKILKISAKTVNYHVENIKRKLGVATRVQAIVALYTDR